MTLKASELGEESRLAALLEHFAVIEDQPTLRAEVEDFFATAPADLLDRFVDLDKGHGRIGETPGRWLGDRLVSGLDVTLEREAVWVRRLEVITGEVGRRRWSPEAKARILAEACAPGAVVSEVARRHGLRPQQVFTWRRQARRGALALPGAELPMFAAVVVEPAPGSRLPGRSGAGSAGEVVIEISDVRLRLGPEVSAARAAAPVSALRDA
jgi:transposase